MPDIGIGLSIALVYIQYCTVCMNIEYILRYYTALVEKGRGWGLINIIQLLKRCTYVLYMFRRTLDEFSYFKKKFQNLETQGFC
jgi:hypothetical protein